MVSCVISCQPSVGMQSPYRARPYTSVHHRTIFSWGIKPPRNSRPTATGLTPGILASDIHWEGCFPVQNCRIKPLTTKLPRFINLGFQNTIQAGISRNYRFPLKIVIFVNNNKGLWSMEKKKDAFRREEEVRRVDKQRENSSQNLSAEIK